MTGLWIFSEPVEEKINSSKYRIFPYKSQENGVRIIKIPGAF